MSGLIDELKSDQIQSTTNERVDDKSSEQVEKEMLTSRRVKSVSDTKSERSNSKTLGNHQNGRWRDV